MKKGICNCYRRGKWRRKAQKKQQYYIEQFVPAGEIKVQEYIKLNVPWREKHILAKLGTSLHRLRCETRRWQ